MSPLALAEAEADAEADPWYGNHAYGHHGRARHAYGHSHVAVAHHAPAVAVAHHAVAVAPKCHTVYDTVTSSACSPAGMEPDGVIDSNWDEVTTDYFEKDTNNCRSHGSDPLIFGYKSSPFEDIMN